MKTTSVLKGFQMLQIAVAFIVGACFISGRFGGEGLAWGFLGTGLNFGAMANAVLLIIHAEDEAVDIWALQRKLMWMSGQELPATPSLNRTTLLYYALTLEELTETGFALLAALPMLPPGHRGSGDDPKMVNWLKYRQSLALACTQSQGQAETLRNALASIQDFSVDLDLETAVELLDGTTDVSVTVAGLPLAAGLPARAGYLEVLTSNLSKANPDTGWIEKTPSGKWIKGRNYQEPDLSKVLCNAHDEALGINPYS